MVVGVAGGLLLVRVVRYCNPQKGHKIKVRVYDSETLRYGQKLTGDLRGLQQICEEQAMENCLLEPLDSLHRLCKSAYLLLNCWIYALADL